MKKLTAALFFLCFLQTMLYAEFFNQRNYLVGETAAMMGGAYTALSEDVSGAYYNPGGLAFIEQPALSISANLYSFNRYKRENQHWDENVSTSTFDMVPSTFGTIFSAGRSRLAFSIFQIDNLSMSTMSINSDDSITKWELDSKLFLMGPSCSAKITESLGVGISLFYQYYRAKLSYINDQPSSTDYIQQANITSGGITAHTGIKYFISREMLLGINYGSETYNLHGENSYNVSGGSAPVTDATGRTDADQRLPHRISTGLAYKKDKSFTISLDFIYYCKLSYKWPHSLIHTHDEDFTYEEKAHFDVSLGGEFYLSDAMVLRLGVFTNTSGAPDYEKTEKINMYGGSVGIGFISGGVSAGLGLVTQYGKEGWQESGWSHETARWERFSTSIVAGGSQVF